MLRYSVYTCIKALCVRGYLPDRSSLVGYFFKYAATMLNAWHASFIRMRRSLAPPSRVLCASEACTVEVAQRTLNSPPSRLRRLSAFPQPNQQKLTVARARCVIYYGQPFAWNRNEARCSTKQHGNDRFVVCIQRINANFFLTRTVHTLNFECT